MNERMSLLIVDDQVDNLLILRSLVREHFPFVEIFESTSPRTGLRIAAEKQVDGALLDVQMPEMDGIEMCRRLKTAESTHSVSVILLTSHRTTSELRARGLEAGADDFIHRPLDNVEFVARVNVMLRAKRAENELRALNERLDSLVTEKVRELRLSEQKYRDLYDNAPLPYQTLDENGRLLDVNPAWLTTLGYDRNAVLGKSYRDFLHPDCRADFDRCLQLLVRGGQAQEHELQALHGDGQVLDISLDGRAEFLSDGGFRQAYCVFQDISERKRTKASLHNALAAAEEARDKIEAILQSVADGLIFTDMDNRIVLMSPSAETMCGQRLSDLFLQPLSSAIEDPQLSDHLLTIHSGEEQQAVMEIERSSAGEDPQILQAKLSLVMGNDGIKKGVITLLRDVSRERELDRLKSNFIAIAAHELRTPLSSVMGYSDLLLSETCFDSEQREEFISIINQKARVLEKIIDDLLNISRVESGRVIHVEKGWCDLAPELETLVNQYRQENDAHRFELVLPERPVELMVDKGKFIQVMENLLVNAIKFSPAESLVRICCDISEEDVLVSVQDEGIGMSEEQKARIFDKFYRADTSLTAKQGLGLGMAIVKNIVETHGGKIWVESRPAGGTKISFTLPIDQAHDTRPA